MNTAQKTIKTEEKKPNRAKRRKDLQPIPKKTPRTYIGKINVCPLCLLHSMGPSSARCQCKAS